MIVPLVEGTYELFRHFYGLRRFNKGKDRPYGAVVGVLQSVLQIIESGDTYVGVATDHVIESFRNRLGRATRPVPASPALLAIPSAGGGARGDDQRFDVSPKKRSNVQSNITGSFRQIAKNY